LNVFAYIGEYLINIPEHQNSEDLTERSGYTEITEIPKHTLEIVFLGTGNAFSMANRYWGSILLNERILLDASPIVVPHMKHLNRDFSKLEYIFLTHFHADHFFGLPFLFLDFAYLQTLGHPLNIIGPTKVEEKITHVTNLGFSGVIEKLKNRLKINYFEVTQAGTYNVSGLKFTAIPMDHAGTEAYGYRIPVGDKTVAYTGDTDLCAGVFELAAKTDILIIELSNPHDDVPGHMSLQKIQKLRERLSPDVQIILNHVGLISGEITQDKNLILPKDLDVLEF